MASRSGTVFIASQPLLNAKQYHYWSSWSSHVSEAIVVGVLAARFIPPAVGLPEALDDLTFIFLFISGLTIAWGGSILARKGESS